MTDLEISKALALAIGWTKRQCGLDGSGAFYTNISNDYTWHKNWKVFDYRDWNVIGPIAERYDCFPKKDMYGQWVAGVYPYVIFSTPQKAIALAVIAALDAPWETDTARSQQ